MEEIWKDINGFEGLYQISNLGRVKGFVRVMGKIISQHPNEDGYLKVVLRKDGKRHKKYVHRLVAEAFVSNPEGLSEVNHIDEDKTNNKVSNLEWCTHEHNMTHGTLQQRSADSYAARTNPILMYNINGELVKRFDNFRQIEEELKYPHETISQCCSGRQKSSYGYLWIHEEDIDTLPQRIYAFQNRKNNGKTAVPR